MKLERFTAVKWSSVCSSKIILRSSFNRYMVERHTDKYIIYKKHRASWTTRLARSRLPIMMLQHLVSSANDFVKSETMETSVMML